MSSTPRRRRLSGMVLGLALLGVIVAAAVLAVAARQRAGSRLPIWGSRAVGRWWAGWWRPALGAVPSTVLLARAWRGQTRYRRSHAVLLDAARHLDEVSAVSPSASTDADGLTDVLAAMRLSALRLHAQLAQERAFSGQVAHQLRTPLTALGLQIEELTMHPETPRMVRADLQRARAEVDRLADIIADLLALARRGSVASGPLRNRPGGPGRPRHAPLGIDRPGRRAGAAAGRRATHLSGAGPGGAGLAGARRPDRQRDQARRRGHRGQCRRHGRQRQAAGRRPGHSHDRGGGTVILGRRGDRLASGRAACGGVRRSDGPSTPSQNRVRPRPAPRESRRLDLSCALEPLETPAWAGPGRHRPEARLTAFALRASHTSTCRQRGASRG